MEVGLHRRRGSLSRGAVSQEALRPSVGQPRGRGEPCFAEMPRGRWRGGSGLELPGAEQTCGRWNLFS